jgi:signal transduction histidine kinase
LASATAWEHPKALEFATIHQAVHLNETLEREARRMAQVLHDDAGQLLTAVHIKLDQVTRKLAPRHADRLQGIKGLIEQVEEQLRRLSHELRPTILDDLGLQPAIEFLAQGVARRAGICIRVEGSTAGRLPAVIGTALYRIVQEALTNIARHARARHACIRLWRDECIHCAVRDDGIGFDIAELENGGKCGFGLVGMQERLEVLGGRLLIASSPGHGTELRVSIPLEMAGVPDFGAD